MDKLVNVTIRSVGERFASGGFHLINNSNPELHQRTPKMKPGEVITVPSDHWLTSPIWGKTIEATERRATRPFSYRKASDATAHSYPRYADRRFIEESIEDLQNQTNSVQPVSSRRRKLADG